MAEEKKELTPEQKAKVEEAEVNEKARAIFQKKIDSANIEIGKILEKYGLAMQVTHQIVFVPRQQG